MLFKGDLSKLHPTSLLTSLVHLGKEGILTVTREREVLAISLKDGALVDAHSNRADVKLLRALLMGRLIDRNRAGYINTVRKETEISVTHVLDKLGLMSGPGIREHLKDLVREVLFQLLLWDSGQFQFVDVVVESDPHYPAFDCQSLIMEVSYQVDEWRDAVRAFGSFRRTPLVRAGARRNDGALTLRERMVLKLVDGKRSMDEIVDTAPCTSFQALQTLMNAFRDGRLEFPPVPHGQERRGPPADGARARFEGHPFFDYKRALRRIVLSDGPRARTSELIAFCRDHFDRTLFLTVKGPVLVRCAAFAGRGEPGERNAGGGLPRGDIRDGGRGLDGEPVLSWVADCRSPYFGRVFPSGHLDRLTGDPAPAGGECAVIPLGKEGEAVVLIVLFSHPHPRGCAGPGAVGPSHYVELLSWLIAPPPPASGETPESCAGPPSGAAELQAPIPPEFRSIRDSLRKILLAGELEPRISELMAFCKEHFENTLVLVIRENVLVRCMGFVKDRSGRLRRKDARGLNLAVDTDPVLAGVHRCGIPFVGERFSSGILDALVETAGDGECAVIALKREASSSILIFVRHSGGNSAEVSPFHYLEVISWLISPPGAGRDGCASGAGAVGASGKGAGAAATPAGGADAEVPRARTLPLSPREKSAPAPDFGSRAAPPAGTGDSSLRLKRLLEATDGLPPMPHIVTQALQLLSDPESPMPEITRMLAQDQSLVVRLIRVGNSALYGSRQKVSTLSQAVSRLGTKVVRNLVIAAFTQSLFPMDQSSIGVWGQSLWQHSKECALASRRIAETLGYRDPEEAFIGGLLHDLGKLVILLNMPQQYRTIRNRRSALGISSCEAENAEMGFDHTMVGDLLMEKWNMPEGLRACIRDHHLPPDRLEYGAPAHIVACGDMFSHRWGLQTGDAATGEGPDVERFAESLKLPAQRGRELFDAVIADYNSSGVFD